MLPTVDSQKVSRQVRRARRERHISRRVRIATTAMTYPPFEQPGRLAKFNLVCSCEMCRLKSRWYGKPNPSRHDRRNSAAMEADAATPTLHDDLPALVLAENRLDALAEQCRGASHLDIIEVRALVREAGSEKEPWK